MPHDFCCQTPVTPQHPNVRVTGPPLGVGIDTTRRKRLWLTLAFILTASTCVHFPSAFSMPLSDVRAWGSIQGHWRKQCGEIRPFPNGSSLPACACCVHVCLKRRTHHPVWIMYYGCMMHAVRVHVQVPDAVHVGICSGRGSDHVFPRRCRCT